MLGTASTTPSLTGRENTMSESTPPRSPEPGDTRAPQRHPPANDQPTAPQPQQGAGAVPAVRLLAIRRSRPSHARSGVAVERQTLSPSSSSGASSSRLLLFGGGYLTASVVDSIAGISDGRLRQRRPRMGPGGGELDDGVRSAARPRRLGHRH